MAVLTSNFVNLATRSSDFLLKFTRLPATRFCLGFTSEDGSVVNAEDPNATQWVINGGVTFGCDSIGLPFATFNGTTGYLSAADAAWNSPTGTFTIVAVVGASPAVGMRIISKEPGPANRGWELTYHASTPTTLQFIVSGDGTNIASVTLPNGAPATGTKNLIVARYRAGSQLALWGNGNVAVNNTSIPSSVFNSTSPIEIGRRPAGTDYLAGSIYQIGLYGGEIATGYIDTLLTSFVEMFGVNS